MISFFIFFFLLLYLYFLLLSLYLYLYLLLILLLPFFFFILRVVVVVVFVCVVVDALQKWAWNIVLTASIFVVPFFIIWSTENSVAWYSGSTQVGVHCRVCAYHQGSPCHHHLAAGACVGVCGVPADCVGWRYWSAQRRLV